METSQPPRMPARILVIASLVSAAVLLIALFFVVATPSAEQQRDNWAVTVPPPPGTAAANAPPGAGAAEAASTSKGTAPSEDMAHALALSPTAIVRDVKLLSRDLGIRCGEVSSDGGVTFKRFFHIDTMKTGRVDDGSEDFRQHAANVCTSRS